jgi:hypothetical protein
MTFRTSELTLYDKPATLCFSQSKLVSLQHALEQLDSSTTILSVQGLEELTLRADGRTTVGGYRYTSVAFHQLTGMLARGSATLLRDLSGSQRRPGQAANGQLARRVFNDILALRLPSLTGCRLVRNEAGKVIDGLLGPNHRILENSALLKQVQSVAATTERGMGFFAGVLMGRRLMLWYREPQAVAVTVAEGKTWNLYPGFYFANGEVRGTGMRGTAALLTPRGCCLGDYSEYGDRMAHQGRNFEHRLDKLFRTLCSREFPLARLVVGLQLLAQTPLGFGESPIDPQDHQHKRWLAHRLGDLHVPANLAKLVVEHAVRVSSVQPELPWPVTMSMRAQRTALDFWSALITVARRLPLAKRELLERAGWHMLHNGFQIER